MNIYEADKEFIDRKENENEEMLSGSCRSYNYVTSY